MSSRVRPLVRALSIAFAGLAVGACGGEPTPDAAPRFMDAGSARDATPPFDAAARDAEGVRMDGAPAADGGSPLEGGTDSDAEADAGVPCAVPPRASLGTAEGWLDYLIQDTCREGADPVAGDPLDCTCHSNLLPGELVHSGFKYAHPNRLSVLSSLPRRAPFGVTGLVLFDSGNGVDGKGLFDLDDPHCRVPGSLCFHDGDVDIVDIVEASWDSSHRGRVSVSATAHRGTGGYLGWTVGHASGSGGDWPDSWLLGDHGGESVEGPIELNVVVDRTGATRTYDRVRVLDTSICTAPLGDVTSPCAGQSFNQWRVVDRMYMGLDKTFDDVLVGMHTVPSDALMRCEGHLELFLHSREYGLMSHQTWRPLGCSTGPPSSNDCDPNTMIEGPLVYSSGGVEIEMERTACIRAVRDGPVYRFDPRALPAPSRPEPYPDARVVPEAGEGNLLLNPQFAWRDAEARGWTAFDATLREVEADTSVVMRGNDALVIACDGDCVGSSVYQDVDVARRAPHWRGRVVDFGARVARVGSGPALTGRVYLWQFDAEGRELGAHSVRLSAARSWPDREGDFVEGQVLLQETTARLRYQVYVDRPGELVLDDLFVVPRP